MKLKSILMFFFAFVLLNSCSDNGSDPESNEYKDYYPSTLGSYWIYENYQSDADMGELNLVSRDSVYVAKDTVVSGKKCQMLITINTTENQISDTSYQRLSDSKLYVYSEEGNENMPIGGWIQMIDFSKSSGTVLDSNITTKIQGITISANLKVNYLLDNTSHTFNIDNKSYSVKAYDYTLLMNGNAMGMPITVTSKNTMYFVKNIGGVQEYASTELNARGQTKKDYTLKKLIAYKIK